MTDGQKPNKPLFSQHYLEHRIQECPEWQVDLAAGFEAFKKLYRSKKDLLPTLSEAQTEDIFIKPALDILGFSNIPQVTTRGKGRAERPDYALFTSEADRDAAYPLQNDESAFYARVRVIAEAKYWERPLSKVSANDQRDIYKNTNPSFQIASYLTGTGVDWGILTNGREWRLYYRQASSTATEFYPVDLVALLESDDLERFKYFWLFFRQEALVKDPQGRNFLERVREGSTTYAQRVGNELKSLVFERVFPGLAGGFVVDATRRGDLVTAEQVYEATLSFLYKLLFLLYAEARNLLPIDRDYRDHSLIKMTQEVTQGIERQKKLSQTSTGLYDRLLSLFQIVDRGDPGLDVPRYNGGLFHFDFSQSSDQAEYRANHFLFRFKLSDTVLAPVLDQLARFEGQPIDYSFLGVRQLGSIYEGLLEYRVVIEDTAKGQAHLENDKGERKATGSYYTPDYIVKYIVSHALKPILAQRQTRFDELMTQIVQLHSQMQDKRLGEQSLNGLRKDLQRLEREAQSTLLDIKVCDPAMGSGHFLVEAVDYLTDELIRILTLYPEQNPVLEMLEQTRQSILQNLEQQGIAINPDRLEPTQLLQRVVMKRCIYGVDLNPMAVELAKVSLWLHSFTIGAPLSFLDHHLRCGNSLIGTTAREAEAAMSQEKSGQLIFLTGPFVGLLRAAEIMRGVSVLSDATFAEVEQSETLFRSFDEAAKPYKRLLDIYVSKLFGLKRADHFLRVFGTNAITADPKKMNKADAAVYDDALKLSTEKRFFHWDLEFPEVFIDLENASWKEDSGFDVVIGNPPYISTSSIEKLERIFFKKHYQTSGKEMNTFSLFTENCLKGLSSNSLISFIVPDSLLNVQSYALLRIKIDDTCRILRLAEIPGGAFDDAIIGNSLIFVFERKANREFCEDAVVSIDRAVNLEGLTEVDKIAQNDYQKLSEDRVFFTSSKVIHFIERTKIFPNLEKLADIKDGIKTGSNSGFVTRNSTKAEHKKLLLSSDIDRYNLQYSDFYILYDRAKLARPREEYIFNAPQKIIIRQTGDSLTSALDCEQLYTLDNTHLILLKNSPFSYFYLLSLLNSSFLDFMHQMISGEEGRVYAQVRISNLEKLPIRNISFTTPTDRRQQALKTLIGLYNQSQLDHDVDPLLAQVNHHLNQQPEEADVIHDLLAHLAEQMIELNKQKQAEIKSFLQWFERCIGCPIDSLANKSKIQNYLGDYSKEGTDSTDIDTGEPHLSFDALIDLLKKNKKKIKIDPTARKEQQTLEKEYKASLETLLPLKMQLMQCDRLIDQIVYQLYGLTEEEVAIVEGKNTKDTDAKNKL
jgi:hypothetical protein